MNTPICFTIRFALKRLAGSNHGGMVIRSVMVLLSFTMVGSIIYVILQKHQHNQQIYHRKALAIAEYGLFQALQKVHTDPSWTSGFHRTTYNDGWYRVGIQPASRDDTLFLTVRSEGHMGSASSTKECILFLRANNNDSLWVRYAIR